MKKPSKQSIINWAWLTALAVIAVVLVLIKHGVGDVW